MNTAMDAVDDTPVPAYADLLRLDERGVVVVGAGQGIGRQTAHALGAVGARVLCVDIEGERAERVAAEVDGIPFVADARERGDVERMLEAADQAFGRLDGVVDILGMARYAPIVEVADEDWDWTFGMVLRHAFLVVQLAGRLLADRGGGSLVLVGSISGMTSAPFHGAYGAAKAGLLSLVRTAAVELGPSGVRINAVSPGSTATPRVVQMQRERGVDIGPDPSPLGRVNQPSDIAAAALFLMSDLARQVTGQTLVVDGGAMCLYPYALAAVRS
jgi:NAD(P)-dependent dehydrogenase (short-subunit alcohol dehydrogenase family)